MIYNSEESARFWAAELNKRPGYLPSHAVLMPLGWAVLIIPAARYA